MEEVPSPCEHSHVDGLSSSVLMQEVNNMNQEMDAHEGCHVVGWLDVRRVAGNFHFTIHGQNFMMLRQVQSSPSLERSCNARLPLTNDRNYIKMK